MIPLSRLPLTTKTLEFLKERTDSVASADKDQAKKTSKDLWKLKQNLAFDEIKSVLQVMNGGLTTCHYCHGNEASEIDHFQPVSDRLHGTFDWTNFIWSCDKCNSSEWKGHKFPLHQGRPLLLNPTQHSLDDGLCYTATGLFYEVGQQGESDNDVDFLDLRNDTTIKTLGLNSRNALVEARATAWSTIPDLLKKYDHVAPQNLMELAAYRKTLTAHLHIGVLTYFWHMRDRPEVIGQKVCDLLGRHPEVGDWVDPEKRALASTLSLWQQQLEQNLVEISEGPKAPLIETLLLGFPKGVRLVVPKPIECQDYTGLIGARWSRFLTEQGKVKFVFHKKGELSLEFHINDLHLLVIDFPEGCLPTSP